MKNMKRFVSLLLVVAMLASLPVMASAAGGHTHKLVRTTVARTCTSDGYTTVNCDVDGCNLEYVENWIPSYHDFPNHSLRTVRNDDGTTSYFCTRSECGGTELFAARTDCNHKIRTADLAAVSCEHGEFKVEKCENEGCGYERAVRGQNALGHHWVEVPDSTVAATVTTPGSVDYMCDRTGCDATYTAPIPTLAMANQKATVSELAPVYRGSNGDEANLVGYLPAGTNVHVYAIADDSMYQIDKSGNYWIPADKTGGAAIDEETPRIENCGNHKYQYLTQVTATCETKGYNTQKCQNCDVYKLSITPALGHDWKEIERVPATATVEGYVNYECRREDCAETKTDILPVIPETYYFAYIGEEAAGVYNSAAANKTLIGYLPGGINMRITIYGESVDGATGTKKMYKISASSEYWVEASALTDEPVLADGALPTNCGNHENKPIYLQPADCDNRGFVTNKCAKCDYYTFSSSPALGHIWDEGRVLDAEQPTSTEEGLRRFYCIRKDADGNYVHSSTTPKASTMQEYELELKDLTVDEIALLSYIKTEKVAKIQAMYETKQVVTTDAKVRDASNIVRDVLCVYTTAGVDKKLVGFAPMGARVNVYART